MSSRPRQWKTLAVMLAAGGAMVAGFYLRGETLTSITFEDRPATTRFEAGGGTMSLRSEVEMTFVDGPREDDLPRLAFDVVLEPLEGGETKTMSCDATPGIPRFVPGKHGEESIEIATWKRPLDDCPLDLPRGRYELTVTPRWTHRGRNR